MKPITSLPGSFAMTAAIVIGLAFLASSLSTSSAESPPDLVRADSPTGDQDTVGAESGLQVEITDVRNEKGRVLVLVFDDASAFASYDYERAAGYVEIPATRGTLKTRFPKLITGPYAVALFHDENGDYDLNMDGMYPLEGYGTSGAKDSYHEPTFDEASVGAGLISVRMYYLR